MIELFEQNIRTRGKITVFSAADGADNGTAELWCIYAQMRKYSYLFSKGEKSLFKEILNKRTKTGYIILKKRT